MKQDGVTREGAAEGCEPMMKHRVGDTSPHHAVEYTICACVQIVTSSACCYQQHEQRTREASRMQCSTAQDVYTCGPGRDGVEGWEPMNCPTCGCTCVRLEETQTGKGGGHF